MSLYSIANNATTTLNGAITAGATTIVVASSSGFPSSGNFVILIDTELMLVTAGNGTTSWTVTRALEGTTAAAHSNGATVANVISQGTLTNNYVDMFSNQTVAGNKTLSGTLSVAGTIAGGPTINPTPTIASYPKVTGVGAMNVGSAPTLPGANMIVQGGSDVVTLDVNSQANISYPVTFPNGVVTVVVCNGDGAAGSNRVWEIEVGSCTTALFNFKVKIGNTGVGPGAVSVRTNWIALGY